MLRFFARMLTERARIHIAMNLLFESAFVRKGEKFILEMTALDPSGNTDIDIDIVAPNHWVAKDRVPHNNLNHCNAAGCNGVECSEGHEHKKGDF